MLGLQQLSQVITVGTLCVLAAAVHGRTNCPHAQADSLLGAAPAMGTGGFVLTQRVCATTIVRSRSVPAPVEANEPVVVTPLPAPPAVAPVAAPVAPPPALPAPVTTRRDPAGQARIRSLAPLMAEVAARHDIDPLLLHALAHIESRHQSQAISPAGARGLMQVMPATGRDMGVAEAGQLLTPQSNLEASARYLKRLQKRFGNDLRLVLAAYNAGEGAVERHGRRVPPYAETQAYVRDVMAVYAELRRWFGGQA